MVQLTKNSVAPGVMEGVPIRFLPRQVCEKYLAKGKNVFWAFNDMEMTYFRIDREALWWVLRLYGVGGNMLKAVQSFYVCSRACMMSRELG